MELALSLVILAEFGAGLLRRAHDRVLHHSGSGAHIPPTRIQISWTRLNRALSERLLALLEAIQQALGKPGFPLGNEEAVSAVTVPIPLASEIRKKWLVYFGVCGERAGDPLRQSAPGR